MSSSNLNFIVLGSTTIQEHTIVNISDFQKIVVDSRSKEAKCIDKYDVNDLYFKINTQIKKEYASMLKADTKIESNSYAVVPKQDSSKQSLSFHRCLEIK